MPGTGREYVFGYGSLVDRLDREPRGKRVGTCELSGYGRAWSVAMDNGVDLPGYKYYVDARTGVRPDLFVAFLNIAPAAGSRVNGALTEVSPDELAELDERERNYARTDVTAKVTGVGAGIGGTVWSYVGAPDAVERFATGLRTSRVVIGEEYYERVRRGFAAAAEHGLREFERLTAPAPCPIVALHRVDL